jgi:small subunit ribosomal protein S4
MKSHRQKPKSEYGLQLEEKQGLKATYGLREKQLHRYFVRGENPEGIFGMLEKRLDNVVFRCGFAVSRKAARQLVSHGHIQLNARNVNIPSQSVRIGDVVSVHPASVKIGVFKDMNLLLKKYEPPAWIELDKENYQAKIIGMPIADDPLVFASLKPVIEFYSR